MSSAPPPPPAAAAASSDAGTAVSSPALLPPAPVHMDHSFLPPSLARLLNVGTAPYTADGSLGPLQTQSAGSLFAGPVSSLYAGVSSSSPAASARSQQPSPPPAAVHSIVPAPPPPTASHQMRAIAPAPAAAIYTAAGPTVADAAHANHGGYPLYAAPYGQSPHARPSYGAYPGQGAYPAPPPYGAPYPYGPSHLYAPAAAPSAPVISPTPYVDAEAALAAISSPPFLFSHLLPVKLKPDNYLYWRAQVLPLLRSHYLEGFVNGTLPCPPPHHPMFRAWIAQDQAILSAIQSSLGEGVAGLVLFASSSHEVWDILESSFSSQSTAQSMAIRAKLGETRKDNGTVTTFYNKIKKLADTLASIGEPLRDSEFTSFILAGLDSDYDSLAEVINERKEPLRPQELYSRLL